MKTRIILVGARAFGGLLLLMLVSVFATGTLTASTSAPVFLMQWGTTGTGNGQFSNPRSVALDSQGNVYVADSSNQRIQKFDNFGNFLKTWGTSGSGNGQFNEPRGIGINGNGNLYVADSGNNRVQVFDTEGNYLNQWGSLGTGNNQFDFPRGVCFDASNNVYVTDWNNNRMMEFTSAGVYIRKWGSQGSGNSQFDAPHGCVIDGANDIYVVEQNNHRVQKFDLDTNPPTFLLKWGSQGNGDGQFNQPHGILLDSGNHIQVADTLNHRIQEFNTSGGFVRKWGTEGTGDGQFKEPRDLEEDANGNFFVADTKNDRIQRFGTKYDPSVCSVNALINAIYLANNTAGADTLELNGTCTYTLTAVTNYSAHGPNGLPLINSQLTINGNGATITRSSAGGIPAFRILEVGAGDTSALNNATISDGRTPDGGANANGVDGGGIYNNGTLTLTNSRVSNNRTGNGGNGSGGGPNSGGWGGMGGGIYSIGTLTLTNSSISSNTTGNGGDGVSGGAGGHGGAITNEGGTLNLNNSTISGNVTGKGGAGSVAGSSNNGGWGGGIANDGTLNVNNSTITNNTTGIGGTGVAGGYGSAIANFGGTLTVTNSTISSNTNGSGGLTGLWSHQTDATTILKNTILDKNVGGNCDGPMTNGGNNLDSDGSCNVGAATDPKLDLTGLNDNGGPTQTIALQNDSPAIDTGNDTVCAAAPINGVDQRGIARPQGPHCDIGAFEKELTTQTIDDTTTRVQYNGWRGEENSNAFAGTYRESNTKNDTVTYTFKGTAVTWVSRKGPDMGIAQVTIDGANKGNVDLYNATEQWQYKKTFKRLPNATHTIEVQVLGTKNAKASDTNVGVDGFKVGTSTADDTVFEIRYNTWAAKAKIGPSGGTFHSSGAKNAKVRFTFTGTQVEWITAKGPNYGRAKVLIDGVNKGTFDLYATSQQWKSALAFTNLGAGQHTIEIRVLGTKKVVSKGTTVIMDAFRGPFQ